MTRTIKTLEESFADFKARLIDPVSDSFCAAKWLNATIWLNQGTTASCHHPAHHTISIEDIKRKPDALHNTAQKIEARKQMLAGERPSECNYCWRIEDMDKDLVSDRAYKSAMFSEEDIATLPKSDPAKSELRTLEISFDRTCNFACSYCSPTFSTTWANDIKDNGPYEGLDTDKRLHYKTTADWAQPYRAVDNPYIKAFWEWWPDLYHQLDEIRITGGEPLLSKDVWRMIEHLEQNKREGLRFAINTNLGAKQELVDKLISATHNMHEFNLFTSCEAFGEQAEYIRDGLDFKAWQANLLKFLEEGNVGNCTIMMTVNALSLYSITDFIDWVFETKKVHKHKLSLSVNLLRHPEFMSIDVLPIEERQRIAAQLEQWWAPLKNHTRWWHHEKEQIERMIAYVKSNAYNSGEHGATREDLERDFVQFYKQYDTRRGKSLLDIFDKLNRWL